MPVVEVPGIGNVHLPDGMSEQEMSQAIDGLLAQQKSNGGQLPASGTIPQPQDAMVKRAGPRFQPTTPGEQLREDNNPITRGLGASVNELAEGGGQVIGSDSSLLQRLLGLARMVNSPAVGMGNAVGTTAHNVLSNIPGLGGPEGVVPAAGAAIADAATQLVTGPKVIKEGVKGLKATAQIPARIFAPGLLRRAGGEAIAQELGAPASALERVFSTPASKAAYTLAEGQGPLPTQPLADIVEQAFMSHADMANPNNPALRYLSNLEEKFRNYKQLPYREVMKEVQALKEKANEAFGGANPKNVLGQTLKDTREFLIQQLDQASPLYRQANRLYRQESAVTDIMNAVRQGTPGANLEKLIENHPDVAKSFSPKVIQEITHIARELSDVASSTPAGGFRQFLQAASKPMTDMLMGGDWGRALLRTALRAPKDQLPRAMTGAIQTYKAMSQRQSTQDGAQ